MGMRSKLITGILASTISLGGGAAFAQDASPSPSPATIASPAANEIDLSHIDLTNPDGDIVGVASIMEHGDSVMISITSEGDSGLQPGEHGVHIHETGICDADGADPYESAGGHFNPTEHEHGAPDSEDSHAGDLGNLTVEEDGSIHFEITTDNISLEQGAANSLNDADGSSLVIHAGEDDLTSQPSGDSGSREACGVIFPPNAPAATPEMEEATPIS